MALFGTGLLFFYSVEAAFSIVYAQMWVNPYWV